MIRPLYFNDRIETPNVWNAFGIALGVHVAMFIWNPILLSGGGSHQAPVLMRVEFRDQVPALPKPVPPVAKKIVKERVVKKAHKSGISLANRMHAPAQIHPVKHVTKLAALPAPRSRPAPMKMPKFIPHASDEDALVTSHTPRVALTTAIRPASTPMQTTPALKTKTRGIRTSDVHFELSERSGISGAAAERVVNIPIGEERGETAAVASAPELHNAPKGLGHTSGYHYQAPLGEGVGELAGKNRAGYVGAIQVGEPSEEQVVAAGNTHGSSVGSGVEIGGPVGDRKILRRHLPEYPAWAEEKGISAIVKIFFTVKPDGTIRRSLRIVRSSGYSELDTLAKEALLAWKFSATDARSSADDAWGVITFRFTLA